MKRSRFLENQKCNEISKHRRLKPAAMRYWCHSGELPEVSRPCPLRASRQESEGVAGLRSPEMNVVLDLLQMFRQWIIGVWVFRYPDPHR